MRTWKHLLMGIIFFSLVGSAEASVVSKAIGKVYSFAITPVNCVANLTAEVTNAVIKFGLCFFNNMNPEQIIP